METEAMKTAVMMEKHLIGVMALGATCSGQQRITNLALAVASYCTVTTFALALLASKEEAMEQVQDAGLPEQHPLYQAVQKDYLLAKAFAQLVEAQEKT